MTRASLYLFVILNLRRFPSFGQSKSDSSGVKFDIVGVWQMKSPIVGSALTENFQFFAGGTFKYNISSYDDLNPLRQISGLYKLDKNILQLMVSQIMVRVGYKILDADHGFESGPFQLKGGTMISLSENDSTYSYHQFENIISTRKTSSQSIKIDEELYFKLSRFPSEYDK